ncbi:MAG: 30S ribosomal protein S7 [Gammaproteobacteria bacterium]|nr:30S ribosomal protein S7 [Gammaproteobacteria bacterium]MYD78134.1 30S ribosomal protein S7 [Gammaproteobacteria bacterium]MYI90306.1 30S ribosomal protein S7 [Gammaproteobacteria bacterium]
MPRRRLVPKRKIMPDPKYKQIMVAKFINALMMDGKKSIAEKILYNAFDVIVSRGAGEPLEIFEGALENVRPTVEVKSRRVGGATYQVPIEVRATRRDALAIRWIIDAARKRREKSMAIRLAAELIEASNKSGEAFKKCENTHKMAEANKAFSHFRY